MDHCLNSYGCYKEVPPGQVFCSEKCRLIYRGELKPDYSHYKPYTGPDKEFREIDAIFQKYFGHHQPPKKKRGVKPGTKRGKYNQPRLERKAQFGEAQRQRRLRRERNQRYYQQKKELQQKQQMEVLQRARQ